MCPVGWLSETPRQLYELKEQSGFGELSHKTDKILYKTHRPTMLLDVVGLDLGKDGTHFFFSKAGKLGRLASKS